MEEMLFILLTFSLYRSVRCHGNHLELPKRIGIDETEAKQFFSDNDRSKRQTAYPYCFDARLEADCERYHDNCANREDTREFLCNMIGTVCLPNEICMVKGNWCPSHFEGKTECVDLCVRNGLICKNGGECRSTSLTSFYCTCQAGYTGADCGIDINECASDPCQSGGLCLDEINRYSCNCASGYTGTNCQYDRCKSGPADIVFLLDSSFSQGQDNFQKQLEFIKNFTTPIYIGQDSVQISVVIISFHAKVEFALTTYANRNSLLAAIARIQYDPGATYTGAALQKAREVLQNGRTYVSIDGYVLPVKKRVIILTDGMASDKVDMKYQASLLRARGVNIVAIGIGSEILHEELLHMASHYSNVFTVSTFDGLNGILSEVGNYLCEACSNEISDILYLLDGSSSVTLSEFQGALDAMQHLTSLVTLGSNKVRLSLVKYAEEPDVVFDFKKYTSAISIHQEIQILYQYPKPANHLKALEYVHQTGFKSTNGARNGVRQVVIWFSNGKSIESSAMDLANKLKTDGKLLVTVGYGSDIFKEVMLNITSYPYMFFHLGEDQYTAVTVLNSLKTLFEFNVCNF